MYRESDEDEERCGAHNGNDRNVVEQLTEQIMSGFVCKFGRVVARNNESG